MRRGFSAISLAGPLTPFSALYLSMASRKASSDSSTAFGLTSASAVPEKNMHREKAAEAGGLIPKQASATMANNRLLRMRIPRSKSSGNHAKFAGKVQRPAPRHLEALRSLRCNCRRHDLSARLPIL
jgi:hypothetical protein